MRTFETLERRQLLAYSAYASLIGQDTLATTRSSLTGAGQVVAVIDTGVDYTHPALGGGIGKNKKILTGYDFIQNDADPQDTDGHGTAVSSFIAANTFTYQDTTYRGIAPDAKLIALRAGTGRNTYESANILRALQWCISNREKWGITVVNMSLGGGAYSDYTTGTYSDALRQLKDLNVMVVASSGNDGGAEVGYPGADPNIFSVGSINATDVISDFSNREAILDLLAPGEQVIGATRYNAGYEPTDGTSFSTPITAGAVALIKQLEPSLTVNEISSVLRTSSVPNRDGDEEFFAPTDRVYGRLDLVAAMNLAEQRATASLDAIATTKHTTIDTVFDKSNILHMAYYEPATRKLMYTTRSDAGLWTTPTSVDNSGAEVGQHLSLAMDQAGRPAIAYYDATNANLKYATLSQGMTWSTRVIESTKSTGQVPSLIFNSIGEPNIAFYSKSSGRLRYASFDWGTDKWSTFTIDGSSSNVGLYSSLAITAGGDIAVAYADQANGELKFAYPEDSTWILTTVDDLTAVGSIDLSFKGTEPLIAYQDQDKSDVKHAWVRDVQWRNTTLISAGNVGKNIKSYFDADGAYHVVYYNLDKEATYDAEVKVVKQVVSVASTTRVGTVGQTASVAFARDGTVTIVGLNRAGRQMYAAEIVDAV